MMPEHGFVPQTEFDHTSVLLGEVVSGLVVSSGGIYVDATLGGAGHATAILKAAGAKAELLGLDQDIQALEAAKLRLHSFTEQGQSVYFRKSNFRHIDQVLQGCYGERRPLLSGVLFDLGVSSPQLDVEDRGFSYWGDALLDMRMDTDQSLTAADILATYSVQELTRIFRDYGEERWAARVASMVVQKRSKEAIQRSDQLVEVIKQAIPAAARREGGHPARRCFQALRIAVNDELGALESALEAIIPWLKVGGRLAVISFHSLEDRAVKHTIQLAENPCTCPPGYPCVCGQLPMLKRITRKPIVASAAELEHNPRARSAKLRIAERV